MKILPMLRRRRARPAPAASNAWWESEPPAPADDAADGGSACGWYESSDALRTGLVVIELLPAEGATAQAAVGRRPPWPLNAAG